jgi:hypothetical protein
VAASGNVTPCFLAFASALAGSHANFSIQPDRWKHGAYAVGTGVRRATGRENGSGGTRR